MTPAPTTLLPQVAWDKRFTSEQRMPVSWIWDGFLAGSNLTLLTGMWKTGKTTLLSILLACRARGRELAGLAVKPGNTLVVTEETVAHWAQRAGRLDFGGNVCFLARPFAGIPRPQQWRDFLLQILGLQAEHGIDLLVLDPLAPLLPSENSSHGVLTALMPLHDLTNRGMAVLAMHHPKKGEPALGQAARGSGALLGHVDISIEMRQPSGNPATRRRRLLAWSRYETTPRQVLIELNDEGTDYAVRLDDGADAFAANWDILRLVFENAPQKLTRIDILTEWPDDYDKPNPTQLRAWLDRALSLDLILREGSGLKRDPFRYWTADREEVWKKNIVYEAVQEQMKQLKIPFQSLTEKRRLDRRDRGFAGSEDDVDI